MSFYPFEITETAKLNKHSLTFRLKTIHQTKKMHIAEFLQLAALVF